QFLSEKIAAIVHAVRSWHYRYSTMERKTAAAPSRPRRVRLSEDTVDDEADDDVDDTAESTLAAPKRKAIVAPRAEKPKAAPAAEKQKKLNLRNSDDEWELPQLDMLDDVPENQGAQRLDEAALQKNAEMLQSTLSDFGVQGDILKVNPGRLVTLYDMEPAPGAKASRVVGVSDDIARSMSAVSARIAAVPCTNAIGIELPNAKRETVYL